MKNKTLRLLYWSMLLFGALVLGMGWCFGADSTTSTTAPPPLNWADLISLVLTPALIGVIKVLAPRIPKVALPALAPVLGAGLEIVCYYSGAETAGTMWGAILGGAGVWLREMIDQVKKTQVPPTTPAVVAVAVLSGTLLLAPGCSSVPVDTQIRDMATVAELASYTGARYDLIENPDHRAYYESSVIALSALIQAEDYDPARFAAALKQLPVRELQDDQGALIIGAAIILWDSYAARIVNLDKTTYVKPVIAAVRRGLSRALGG